MRLTKQEIDKDRSKRRRLWNLYVSDPDWKSLFGQGFRRGLETYRVDAWLPQNKTNPILVTNVWSEQAYVMSRAEFNDLDITSFHALRKNSN
jgi:hypothetical protein